MELGYALITSRRKRSRWTRHMRRIHFFT